MAYDMNRCPQTEDEFQQYFSTLTGTTLGQDASGWEAVMKKPYPWKGQSLMIPEGVQPGIQQKPDAPFYGLTQQISNNVPKGRVFLPSNQPDELGYYTRCMQYLDDAAATYSKARNPRQDFTKVQQSSGGLIYAWYHVAGNAYSPVLPADGGGGIDTGTPAPPSGGSGGLTESQVQAMIDASLQGYVKVTDTVAIQMSSGLHLSFEGGGPSKDGDTVKITGKKEVHDWESVKLIKGEREG